MPFAVSPALIALRRSDSLTRNSPSPCMRVVPFAVEGDRSYYRRREILDAASLVGAVLDPNDALSLVALLRSSAAGVPDAAWLPLW